MGEGSSNKLFASTITWHPRPRQVVALTPKALVTDTGNLLRVFPVLDSVDLLPDSAGHDYFSSHIIRISSSVLFRVSGTNFAMKSRDRTVKKANNPNVPTAPARSSSTGKNCATR